MSRLRQNATRSLAARAALAALLSGAALAALAGCETTKRPPIRVARGAQILTRTATLPFPPPLPELNLSRELPPAPSDRPLALRVGTVLRIDVAGVDALSVAEVQIGSDGRVFLPFLGRVQAAGLTALQLGQALQTQLVERGYLRAAQVDVTAKAIVGKVYVLGRVVHPGAYSLPVGSFLRLTQVIAMAGGLYRGRQELEADHSAIRLIREIEGKRRTFRISFMDITVGGRLEADVPLQSGDVIYVPPQQELFVFGSVNKPGGFALLEGSHLGTEEVLALAGGFSTTANQNELRLVRRSGRTVGTYRIPADPVKRAEVQLGAGDTLIIPTRGLRRVFVLGAVSRQGGIPLDEPDLTVTKALALAGGLNRIAAGNSVQLIRRGPDGQKHTYPVPVADIIARGDLDQDPVLEPGDIIWVPEGFF